MKKILSLIVLSFFFACHIVKADIAFQTSEYTQESSNIGTDKPLKIELRDAIVIIDTSKTNYPQGHPLKSTFTIFSNEIEPITTRIYLKAKGKECNETCRNISTTTTEFNINNQKMETSFLGCETPIGELACSKEFILQPQQITTISISQNINLPFQYYLDSLNAFQKINHEKITIQGKDLNVKFNQFYPAKKISDTEWVWEYSNINPQDKNVNSILTIEKKPTPIKTEPPKNLFQKIIDYFKGVLKRTKNILIY